MIASILGPSTSIDVDKVPVSMCCQYVNTNSSAGIVGWFKRWSKLDESVPQDERQGGQTHEKSWIHNTLWQSRGQKKKIQYVIQVGQKLLLPTKQVSSSLLHYGNERFNEKRSSRTEDTFLCRCSIKHAQTDWNPAR